MNTSTVWSYKAPSSPLVLPVGWNQCCYYHLTQVWQLSEVFTHNAIPKRLDCLSSPLTDSLGERMLVSITLLFCLHQRGSFSFSGVFPQLLHCYSGVVTRENNTSSCFGSAMAERYPSAVNRAFIYPLKSSSLMAARTAQWQVRLTGNQPEW